MAPPSTGAAAPSRLLPHHADIPTSRAQAERLTRQYPHQRERILAYLNELGTSGATRAEIASALAIKIQSVCPMVFRLIHDEKLVEETARQRNGGFVLVLTDAGRRYA